MSEWIEHDGGLCPVHHLAWVNAKLRSGEIVGGVARLLRWSHLKHRYESDIIAYRIVEEEA